MIFHNLMLESQADKSSEVRKLQSQVKQLKEQNAKQNKKCLAAQKLLEAHSKEMADLKRQAEKLDKSEFLGDYSKQIIEEIHYYEKE